MNNAYDILAKAFEVEAQSFTVSTATDSRFFTAIFENAEVTVEEEFDSAYVRSTADMGKYTRTDAKKFNMANFKSEAELIEAVKTFARIA